MKTSTVFIAFIFATLVYAGCGVYDEDGTDPAPPAMTGGTRGSATTGPTGGTGGSTANPPSDVPAQTIVCAKEGGALKVSFRGPLLHTLADGSIGAISASTAGEVSYGGDNVGSWDPRQVSGKVAWTGDSSTYKMVLPGEANRFNLAVIDKSGGYKWLQASEWMLKGACISYGGNGGTQILTR